MRVHNKSGILPTFIWPVLLVLAMVALLMLRMPVEDNVSTPVPPQLFSSSYNLIGTGNRLGTYYPAGHILADWFNGAIAAEGGTIKDFKAVETNGSMDNLRLIHEGKLALAMIESRIVKEGAARYGTDTIRLVWPLWPDIVHLIRAPAIGENHVFSSTEIIFPGQENSSTFRTTKEIFEAFGQSLPVNYSRVVPEDLLSVLINGKIEYANIQAGIPNRTVSDALIFHNCSLVSFTDAEIEKLLPRISTSRRFVIPYGFYGETQPETVTFGLSNFLVTTAGESEEMIEMVAELMVRGAVHLKMRHQALADVPSDVDAAHELMQEIGLPIHSGALKYIERRRTVKAPSFSGEP